MNPLLELRPRFQKFLKAETRLEPNFTAGIDRQFDDFLRYLDLEHGGPALVREVPGFAHCLLLWRADRHRPIGRTGGESTGRIGTSRFHEFGIRAVSQNRIGSPSRGAVS